MVARCRTFRLLAGDRHGLSFYGYDLIRSLLQMTLEAYLQARDGLLHKDLLAFDGTRFQVLSLPATPVAAPSRPLRDADDLEDRDPATIRRLLQAELGTKS